MVWSLRCCGRLDSPMEAAIVVVLSALRRRTHLTAKVTKLTLRELCLPTECGIPTNPRWAWCVVGLRADRAGVIRFGPPGPHSPVAHSGVCGAVRMHTSHAADAGLTEMVLDVGFTSAVHEANLRRTWRPPRNTERSQRRLRHWNRRRLRRGVLLDLQVAPNGRGKRHDASIFDTSV